MGRDTWRFRQSDEERDRRKQMNPIWRGCGCILIVTMAVAGYFFAEWFIRQNSINHWIYIPPEALRPDFAPWLPYGMAVKIVVALIGIMFAAAIMNIIYAVLFPIQPGETDAPPVKRRPKRRR